MAHKITLIPGDGIGPEVADATARAVEATGVEVEWERVDAGIAAEKATGHYLPEAVFESLAKTHVGLKGPVAGGLLAVSRAAGWIAHVIEQHKQDFMIRPRGKFTAAGAAENQSAA